MIQTTTFLNSIHGHRLFVSVWQPHSGVKAVIVLVHGFGEHCMRYAPYVEYFTREQIAVVGFDQQGHGQTAGKRGKIVSYNSLLDDVELVIYEAKKIFRDAPVILYGHSMGGNIAFNFMIKRSTELVGGIVSSPWLTLTVDPNFFVKGMVSLLKGILPNLTVNSGLETNYLSTNPEEVEKYRNDPLNHGKISFQLFAEITRWGLWAITHAKKLQQPVLLMHGDTDKITSHKSSELTARGNPEHIKWVLWPGGYHELHNEPNRSEVAFTVIQWIQNLLN